MDNNYASQSSCGFNKVDGKTVYAVYRPYDGTNGKDSYYSCAAFVNRFYKEIYGISIYNLMSTSSVPMDLNGRGTFDQVTAPQIGDIMRSNKSVHWAVVKEVRNNGDVVIIHQNAWNTERTAGQCGTVVKYGDTSVSFFRHSNVPSTGQIKGCLDHCSGGSGVVNVSGWALDLVNKTKTMDVYVYVGGPAESYGTSGVEQFIIKANGSRADVGAAYPGTGDYHGFEASLNTTLSSEQDVYVYVMNPETGVSIYIKSIKVNIEDINIAPTVATISSDKKEIAVGEEITFSFSSDYGTQYYIWIVDTADWSTVAVKGSNEGDCYSTLITYSTSSLPVGKYYAYVTASNSAGYIDSAGIYMDVVTVPTVAEITANNPGKNLFGFFFSQMTKKML